MAYEFSHLQLSSSTEAEAPEAFRQKGLRLANELFGIGSVSKVG